MFVEYGSARRVGKENAGGEMRRRVTGPIQPEPRVLGVETKVAAGVEEQKVGDRVGRAVDGENQRAARHPGHRAGRIIDCDGCIAEVSDGPRAVAQRDIGEGDRTYFVRHDPLAQTH